MGSTTRHGLLTPPHSHNIHIQHHTKFSSRSGLNLVGNISLQARQMKILILLQTLAAHSKSIYLYIYIIIDEIERNSNYNSKLEFKFCAICPKLYILKKFYLLNLESNVIPHHKYSSN